MQFDIAGLCFTDATGLAFVHDPSLVLLSYLIAVGGSYASLELIDRWRNTSQARAYAWQIASAAALGGTIWSMHFIAMLALKIDLPLTYAPGTTLLSLMIAIGATGLGLHIVRTRASWDRICLAEVTIGLGVATMHYVGMAAVRFSGSLAYRPSLWSLSILVAIAASVIGLWVSFTLRETRHRALAGLVVAAAICAMHYAGMASTVFQVDPSAEIASGLSSGSVAVAVALTTAALILCALVFVGADRRLLASANRETELLRLSHIQLTQTNAELEMGRQQLTAVLDNITQGVCCFSADKRLLVSNRRYAEIYNLPPEATRAGRSLQEIVEDRHAVGTTPGMSPADYLAWRVDLAADNQPSTTIVTLTNGRVVAISYRPMPGGGWVGTHEDITERQKAEAEIVFMARHDALTRLPNRILFHERLGQAIALAGRGEGCAVLCLDLDHFKLVNDTLGHSVGDGLLQAAADRVLACVRDVDTVARLGGDEFAIVQVAVERPDDAVVLANRIIAAFRTPFEINGHQIAVATTIGAALAPHDGTSPDALLKNADIALCLAKSEGRSTVRFFEPEMDARLQSRRTMELDLRSAIARNEFEVYYQPQINIVTNSITSFEALLRWHHPVRGMVSPIEFIPLAEETGMIISIGMWVLRTACLEAKHWPEHISVAVNLSSVQFKDGGLVAGVKAALAESGLPPDRLELEITESLLLQGTEATLDALNQLRAMDIAIALDDFGTGYSSLSYLRSFPFDKIKIDKSFIRDLESNSEAMSIVRAITGLGHSLLMKTTGEGVETQEQLDKLREEGCTEAQGFLFSAPKPASELPSMIRRLSVPSTITT
jgi:diguanylate cyclase (GGDEF)-like protein